MSRFEKCEALTESKVDGILGQDLIDVAQNRPQGGALALRGDIGGSTLSALSFVMCTSEGDGGAVHLNGARRSVVSTIKNVTFDQCSAMFDGGALFTGNDTAVNTLYSSFENCASGKRGGALFAAVPVGSVQNSLFVNNEAGVQGGAIHLGDDYSTYLLGLQHTNVHKHRVANILTRFR